MNKLLIVLLLFSFGVFAGNNYPSEEDSIEKITKGSYIELTRDFHLRANLDMHSFTSIDDSKGLNNSCIMLLKKNAITSYDRWIKAGTRLRIEFVGMKHPRVRITNSYDVDMVFCYVSIGNKTDLTINQLRKRIYRDASLVLAPM
ncbi:MAG: hypothetical protein N4A33_11280 [Bacteriovoracaceae bacterium]|nr:hypothetical protein [Bacteriovoracaceae bacterium]